MSNLSVFDPLREMASMRSMMDQMFDNAVTRQVDTLRGMDWMALDVYQTDNDVVVKATLPGINPDDINISITQQILTIRGEIKEEKVVEKATYHIRERRTGSLTRSVQLPTPVISDRAKAEYENGVLTLILPKAEEVRPKSITVKVK
jgi:HSP20 family protein